MAIEHTLIITDKLDVLYFGKAVDSPGLEFGKTGQEAYDKLRELSRENDYLHYYRIRMGDKDWDIRYWQIQKRDRRPGLVIVNGEDISSELIPPELAGDPDEQPYLSLDDLISPDEFNFPLEYLIHAATAMYRQQLNDVGLERASILGAQLVVYRECRFMDKK